MIINLLGRLYSPTNKGGEKDGVCLGLMYKHKRNISLKHPTCEEGICIVIVTMIVNSYCTPFTYTIIVK